MQATADLCGHVLPILIPSIWLAILAFSVAICHAAARGDDVPAARRAEQIVKDAKHGARQHRAASATRGRGGS